MKKLIAYIALALFSTTSAYAAHTQLEKSTPADGSTLSLPLSAIVLEFSRPVQMHTLYIKKDDSKSTPISSLPPAHA